jgi:hypothetical protein
MDEVPAATDSAPAQTEPAPTTAATAESSRRQTAPFPHRLTILLSLLSPGLALIALYVGFTSLTATRDATRRGQQAYVGISMPRFQFHSEGGMGPEWGIVYIDFTIAVDNAGATPATIFDTRLSWNLDSLKHLLPPGTTVNIDAKVPLTARELRPRLAKQGTYELRLFKDGKQLVLPIAAANTIQDRTSKGGLDLSAEVSYKTVFSEDMQYARGCWRTLSNSAPLAECVLAPETVHKSLRPSL